MRGAGRSAGRRGQSRGLAGRPRPTWLVGTKWGLGSVAGVVIAAMAWSLAGHASAVHASRTGASNSAVSDDHTSSGRTPAEPAVLWAPTDPDAAAAQTCSARLGQYHRSQDRLHVVLVAARASTQGKVAADEATRSRPYRLRATDRRAAEFVAVCVFDLDQLAAGSDRTLARRVRRLEAVRLDGTPELLRVGDAASITVVPITGAAK